MVTATRTAPIRGLARPGPEVKDDSSLPPRTADTMSEAIALSSPSGKMSKRARDQANKRLAVKLFGKKGLQREPTPQPSEPARLRRHATELRGLAERGMAPRKHFAAAKKAEAKADALDRAKPAPETPQGITRAAAKRHFENPLAGVAPGRKRRRPDIDRRIAAATVAPATAVTEADLRLQRRWERRPANMDFQGIDTPTSPKAKTTFKARRNRL